MKKLLLITGGLAVAFSTIILMGIIIRLPYENPNLPIETRAEDLLSRMTLGEKIGQMVLVDKNNVPNVQDVGIYGLGAILSGGGAKPAENTPNGWRNMIQEYTKASRSSRLGIPILYGVDAIHGHSNVPGATIFPQAIGLGAANDPALMEKIAEATAEEVRATGISWVFGPNLDTPQDIRWGRVYESFSSDPQIVATLGAAQVKGLQGTDAIKPKTIATLKHYIGAGGMKWGTSGNKTYKIDQGTTTANEKIVREWYLPPFQAAIHAGALSVMAGLNTYGDEKMSAQKYLLTDILKNELQFKGFIVSDWYGVYGISADTYAATVTAINAGIDMAMLPFDYTLFMQNMTAAVEKGDIPMARIDDAVRRILRAKFAVGLFEHAPPGSLRVIGSKKHRILAREAVSASLVLLQNTNHTLPISGDTKRILVAGSAAHNTGRQSGGWTIEWQGVDGNILPSATSILEGIQQVAGSDVHITYNANALFPTNADPADIGIAVVGEKPYAEGVGDNENPALSPEDLATISKLQKISKKIVVIIISGRPLLLPPDMKTWDALIAAWLPGSEGGGVADVLFGKQPFKGKLPLPWPAYLKQLPFSPDGITADNTDPLFPKGFGL